MKLSGLVLQSYLRDGDVKGREGGGVRKCGEVRIEKRMIKFDKVYIKRERQSKSKCTSR